MAEIAHLTLPIITRYEGKEYELGEFQVPIEGTLVTEADGAVRLKVSVADGKNIAVALADAIYAEYGKE